MSNPKVSNITELSSDQDLVLKQLITWYKQEDKIMAVTLGGYAGTGKTTLIALFKKILLKLYPDIKIAVCSFTGKGALVVKNKLNSLGAIKKKDFVGTIHSLIYEPIVAPSGEIIGWDLKPEVKYDLIIVDEASMVDSMVWADLISYKIPILAAGDHGQLPPINSDFNLMERPKLLLKEIHRQVQDNPIIKVSKMARELGAIPIGEHGEGAIKMKATEYETNEKIEEILNTYDDDTLILCGYNRTRVNLNNHIRNLLGREGPVPEPGDRIICLRNNHKAQIFNGLLGTVEYVQEIDENWYQIDAKMDSGLTYSGKAYAPQFNALNPINFTKERKKAGGGDLFDFGYAITVHKAQGSEAKKVVLFEERFSKMDNNEWKRWLYTGVTRAQEQLYIVGH